MFADIEFNPRILLGLERLKITEPTQVQSLMLPLAMSGRDLQVCAETGSGKTLAYVLPVLQRLLDQPAQGDGTRVLILLPTRELARQVFKVLKPFTELTRLQAGVLTGGEEFKFQAAMLRKNPEIVIATTGRLVDHIGRKTIDLSRIECLILDEADRMLDMGFAEDMDIIVSNCGQQRQTFMLSATLRHEGVGRIARAMLSDPETITTDHAREQHAFIQQQRILADDNAHKDRLLTWLLANEIYDKAIVFVNKRSEVDRLFVFLRRHQGSVAALHGEMTQDERNYVMQSVRQGKRRILVATDVAARGLDVEGLDLVINYDLARKGDEYVHRIGRTGRAGQQGTAISLIAPYEWNLKASIERYLEQVMTPRTIKELEGNYKGPKKVKASGKAAGKKKTKVDAKKGAKKAPAKKAAAVKNDKKRAGPRPSRPAGTLMDSEGFAPIKRKPGGQE